MFEEVTPLLDGAYFGDGDLLEYLLQFFLGYMEVCEVPRLPILVFEETLNRQLQGIMLTV